MNMEQGLGMHLTEVMGLRLLQKQYQGVVLEPHSLRDHLGEPYRHFRSKWLIPYLFKFPRGVKRFVSKGPSGAGKSEILARIVGDLEIVGQQTEGEFGWDVVYLKSGDAITFAENAKVIPNGIRGRITPEQSRKLYIHMATVCALVETYLPPEYDDNNNLKRGKLYIYDTVGSPERGMEWARWARDQGALFLEIYAPYKQRYARVSEREEIQRAKTEEEVRAIVARRNKKDKRTIEQIIHAAKNSGNLLQLAQQEAELDRLVGIQFSTPEERDEYLFRTYYPREMRSFLGPQSASRGDLLMDVDLEPGVDFDSTAYILEDLHAVRQLRDLVIDGLLRAGNEQQLRSRLYQIRQVDGKIRTLENLGVHLDLEKDPRYPLVEEMLFAA